MFVRAKEIKPTLHGVRATVDSRVVAPAVLLCVSLALLSGCQGGTEAADAFQWKPLFGDGKKDITPLIAEVGDITITKRDLEMFLEELPPSIRARYDGPEGELLALQKMIELTLMVQKAIDQEIYNDSGVARNLISLRRNTLDYAMRNIGVLKGKEPTDAELRQFFLDNQNDYYHSGRVASRHIECMNKADAQRAYEKLHLMDQPDAFAIVLNEFTVNVETGGRDGELGWYAKDGFIPGVRDGKDLANATYKWEKGLHPPLKIGDRWHVIEITDVKLPRPQTFKEARDKVMIDMKPGFQDALIKDFLNQAREEYGVKRLGDFAPGKGLTADELFARAMVVADGERRIELLTMLQRDYPDSPRADDALFMAADAAMGEYADLRVAARLLDSLLTEYPDSELAADAKYLRDHLYDPKRRNPQSIEDLKQAN